MARGEEDINQKFDKDPDNVFNRVREVEEKLKESKEDNEELQASLAQVAKLGVYNARDLGQQTAKYDVFCFLAGEFKDTVKDKFKEYQKGSKKKREEKEKETEDADTVEGTN